jgi:hypothetical protein
MIHILSEETLDNTEEHLEVCPWTSLRQLSQDTGAAKSLVHTATELLHLKPYKCRCTKTPGWRLYCESTVLSLVLRSSVQWWSQAIANLFYRCYCLNSHVNNQNKILVSTHTHTHTHTRVHEHTMNFNKSSGAQYQRFLDKKF